MWPRPHRAAVSALVLVTVASCSSSGGGGDGEADRPGCDRALDEAFSSWEEAGFSGAVAVTTAGEPDCVTGYGLADGTTGRPNTAGTVFSIGSVSKAFTAAAVLDLVDRGRLRLDERAGDVIPDLSGPVAAATVEQLLLHTSGLTGAHGVDHEPLAREAAVTAIGGLELAFAPGQGSLYSNAGYTLLALIVEERSGTSYRAALTAGVLAVPGVSGAGFWDGDPAAPGPRAVGYLDSGPTDEMGDAPGPHWALAGNGDLAMTMGDLATWTAALFGGEVVSAPSTERLVRPGVDHGDGTGESPGWVVQDASRYGEPVVMAAGGGGDVGHEVVVAWLPESERVVAVASNTPDVTAGDLVGAIGPAWVAGDPLPRPRGPSPVDVDPDTLAALAGTYALDPRSAFVVHVDDDRLVVAADGPEAMAALFPRPEGVDADDVSAHEDGVEALLAGETRAGREERSLLEGDLGPVTAVDVVGTIVADGELRTYVVVTGADASSLLWYALDDGGGVAAAEGPTDPPALPLVPVGDGRFRPDDPAGRGGDVAVQFDGDTLTVTGPAGSVTARAGA